MNSISGLIRQSNPYEQFVQQLVLIESQKKFQLQDRVSTLGDKKSSLGKVSSVISKFTSKIEELDGNTKNNFNPMKASSSNESAIRVDSITGITEPNTYDITVNRKASKDIMLSNVVDGAATDLALQGDGAVDITIGDKTETINVAVTNTDGTDKTNEEILQSFSDAVTTLMGVESDSDVFKVDNNGNVQLSIKSANTGYAERVQFSNASGVLAQVTGNMTHLENTADLDAQFTVDGINFTRGTNTIDDAISGMTFTLLGETATQEQISINKDLEKARENVEGFIEAFNEMNKTIRNQTFLNGETGNRGPLQDIRSIRSFTINLRQMALFDMSSAAAGEIDNLSDMGIGFENDGTMKIEDSDMLDKALSEKADEVNTLFTDAASPIQAMYERAKTYTESNGIISSLESGLDQKIDFLENRVEREDKYLARYEERQREIFAEVLKIQQEGQRQFSAVMSQQATMGL